MRFLGEKKAIFSTEYKVLVQKLKAAREEAGLTQVDVAKRLRRGQSAVSKIERGERRIDPIELKFLARLYRKPLAFFL